MSSGFWCCTNCGRRWSTWARLCVGCPGAQQPTVFPEIHAILSGAA